jgi:Biotin-lipoyl like
VSEKDAEATIRSVPIGRDQASPAGDPPRDRPKRARAILWAATLAIFVPLFWSGLRQAQAAAPTGRAAALGGTASIAVATAKKGDIDVYVAAIGTATPIYTDLITGQVAGLFVAVNYCEGQLVKRGDSLVQIDLLPYEAQLVEAQGALQHRDHRKFPILYTVFSALRDSPAARLTARSMRSSDVHLAGAPNGRFGNSPGIPLETGSHARRLPARYANDSAA